MDFLTVLIGFVPVWIVYRLISFFISKKEKDLNGKVVLVTGAGSGLGRLLSIEFAKLGCKLVLLDINQQGIDAVAKEIKDMELITPFVSTCDVSEKDAVKALAQKVKKEVGKVDVLVNNAGIVAGDFVLNLRDDQVERVMKVNTLSVMWMIRAFLPDMLAENDGHLVTIASAAATAGIPKLADYCASKAATFIYHEAVRMELKKTNKTGVKTTVVCPYYINTGMFDGVKSTSPLLPILEPKYVVEQIMKAVKTNQEELFLPGIVLLSFLMRFFVTSEWRDQMATLFGLNQSMDQFHGQRRVK